MNLQQRRKKPKDALPDPQSRATVGLRHLPAEGEYLPKIRLHLFHRRTAVDHHIVLKMQVQAPVV